MLAVPVLAGSCAYAIAEASALARVAESETAARRSGSTPCSRCRWRWGSSPSCRARACARSSPRSSRRFRGRRDPAAPVLRGRIPPRGSLPAARRRAPLRYYRRSRGVSRSRTARCVRVTLFVERKSRGHGSRPGRPDHSRPRGPRAERLEALMGVPVTSTPGSRAAQAAQAARRPDPLRLSQPPTAGRRSGKETASPCARALKLWSAPSARATSSIGTSRILAAARSSTR